MASNIDPSAKVSTLADIEVSSRGSNLFVGKASMIDSFVKVKFVGGNGDIVMGNRVMINSGCVLYSGNGITIGNDVAVAANCVFAPTNHAYAEKDKLITEQRFLPSKGGIIIEDDVWIGAGCTILDGAILRKGCVIGAMSLIRGEIEAYSINVGNPLKLVGYRK